MCRLWNPSQKPLPWLPWQRENNTDLKKWVNLNQSSLALRAQKLHAGSCLFNPLTGQQPLPSDRRKARLRMLLASPFRHPEMDTRQRRQP